MKYSLVYGATEPATGSPLATCGFLGTPSLGARGIFALGAREYLRD